MIQNARGIRPQPIPQSITLTVSVIALFFIAPNSTLAQSAVAAFVQNVNNAIINPLLALLFALGLLLFFYGALVFLVSTGDDGKRQDGKRHMFWGLVGMVIMVSVFGILQIGLATFNVGQNTLPDELPINNAVNKRGIIP